jgi:ATP/maltotriose-dependent transcriptional regulator MalT/DNA-binding SARP family transcriptional activator
MIEVTQTRIDRPELTGRLAEGLERGSVILIADAGFGKTTALEQTLAERGGSSVWVRAARTDRDPGRLVRRLVEGIRTELPGVAEDHAERLAGATDPLDPESVARSLVEDLERLLVEPLVIVIDDAEMLEGTDALAILDALVTGSGEHVRIALCSRRPLGLKLARLKASGRVAELDSADLAFSPAECAACLRLVRGQEPSGEEVEALFAATEGWPLGVALAAAAGYGGAQLRAGGRDAIFEYLAEEVFDGLEPEMQRQLLDASIVDELDPEMEGAIGLPESFRADLEAAGLFVRPVGDAYALHPLVREFLRARRSEDGDPGAQLEVHRRLAVALAAGGRTPEAIDHWLAGEDYEAAAGAISANGIPLAATLPETVARWLDGLPPELRDQPVLQLLAGRAAVGEGDFDAAVEHCRAGLSGLESEGAPEALLWAARLALTDAHIAALDLESAAAACSGADEAGPEAGPAAAFCALLHAAMRTRLGVKGSDRELESALALPSARELLGPGLAAFRAQYRELSAGLLDDARAHIEEGVEALRAQDPYNRLAYLLAFKMAIHEARGELEDALETFDELQAAARSTGLAGFIGTGSRLSAATILVLLDRPEEARVQLERVDSDWSSWVGCDQHVARALLAAGGDDLPGALRESRLALEEAKRMPAFDRVRPVTVLSSVICDAGEPPVARAALEELLEALGPADSRARARAALACVLYRSGQPDAAHEALAAAFEEAGDGARFLLRNQWPQIERVLWSGLEAGVLEAGPAVDALDGAFPGEPPVVALLEHPEPAVRAAALAAAGASGRPEAIAALAEGDSDEAEALRDPLTRQPPPLRFRTLGRFEIRRGAYSVDPSRWERKVAERVVRLLLIRGGETVSDDELLEALWPEKAPDSARRGLQTAISSARAVLDLPWEETRVRVHERSYALALHDDDRVDWVAFEQAAGRALANEGPERTAAMEAAARLWTGEPLPEERYSDWAASWRERLSSLHADVLSALAHSYGEAGDHAAAARAARSLVDLDPLDEHAQRQLMGAYAAAGRRGDALRQFLECRRALVEELGIEPEAETLALQRRILAGT